MIIKTREFDEMLSRDILDITINKNRPYSLKGSYRIKEYGDIITDIDFSGFVFFNEKFIEILNSILNKNKSSNKFIFLYLDCGKYKEFDVPWKIDNKGDCKINVEELYEWFDYFKKKLPIFGKNFISQSDIQYIIENIRNILSSDTLSLGDLVEIEKILEPYADIKWNSIDIFRGYKIFNDQKYDLYQVLRDSHSSCVMSFIYTPTIGGEQDFCMIEIGLVDKTLKKTEFLKKMYSYYDPGWYKIFKSYKFFVENRKPDKDGIIPFERYKRVMKELEIVSSKYNRIVLLEELMRVSFTKSSILMKKVLEEIGSSDFKKYKEIYAQELEDIAYKYLPYFHDHLNQQKRNEFDMYLLRGKEGRAKISIKELKNRQQKGMTCPFFDLNIEQFIMIYKLAIRLLTDPEKMINCMISVTNEHNLTVEEIFDIFIKDNGSYLEEVYDKVLVKNADNMVIREFDKKDISQARKYVIRE